MIELKDEELVFTFPEIHPEATLTISFQRTLRIPDDENLYPLPPNLGNFPLEHVDDYAQRLPEKWFERGGVMLPIHQSEALWIHFRSDWIPPHDAQYPFAVKIATGKINAVTGENWFDGLNRNPQDYMVIPYQPWLDGYCVGKGYVRQFVAMPLGDGYSAEAQITGSENTGGLQISVYPMRKEAFEKRWPQISMQEDDDDEMCIMDTPTFFRKNKKTDMALAPGGRMKQDIYKDDFDFSEWELNTSNRCFIHLANSKAWKEITGKYPPTIPFTAKEYNENGLPWFDYYSDYEPLAGGDALKDLKSISSIGRKKRDIPLSKNKSFSPKKILRLFKGKRPNQVREWKNY